MKRAFPVAVLVLATVCLAREASALSFSADVPLQYTLSEEFLNSQKTTKPKDRAVTGVSGYVLSASAGWLGVGYEDYKIKPTAKILTGGPPGISSIDSTMRFQIYDVFLDLPLPLLHAVLGYGQGRVSTQFDPLLGETFHVDDADVSQTFVRLGLPIGPLFDVHLGYHDVRAQDAKIPKGGAGPDKLKVSGSLVTAGVRLGW